MKRILLSSALLAVCSMSAMDQKDSVKFRLATSKDDLTPVMQMGLAIYNGMVDGLPVSIEEKAKLKKIQSHIIGYVQAMANAGNAQWPLVLVENEGDALGFSSLEIIDHPEQAIALHMTPLKNYGVIAPQLIKFVREQFPDRTAIVTRIAKDKFTGGESPLKKLIEGLGFKPCDDYKPNSQVIWNPQDFDTYKRSLVE